MEHCTLYCKIKPRSLQQLAERLSAIPGQSDAISFDEAKQSVVCYTSTGSVKLTLMWFVEAGDPFAKLRGKTLVNFESKPGIMPEARERILLHIRQTEAAIGVVADPSFESFERLEAILMFIATEHDALIFNGQEMLDSLGEVVS